MLIAAQTGEASCDPQMAATFYFFVIPNVRRCIWRGSDAFGLYYRALAVNRDQDVVWFWIEPTPCTIVAI